MHPIGMVRVRHFEFVCRTMHIEPTVPRFRVFHQMHYSKGFYSCMQRASAKMILLQPPKYFHDWKKKFFFIKVGVIPMRMTFKGKEDVPTETIQTPTDENWYQGLKDVPSIALPEKALVGASMSLNWRMNREEKPVYMEGDKGKIWVVSLYVVVFEREGGKMATVPKKPDEELWYHRIVRNFALPRDDELAAQPAAVVRRPKPEPRYTANIPPSNPDDPIDLESSPEHLLRKKAGKRKQADAEAEGQPEKKVRRKKITRRGNLDAFIAKPVHGRCYSLFSLLYALNNCDLCVCLAENPNSPVHTEPSSVVNEDLPPSPPRAFVTKQLENAGASKNETEKTAGVENPVVEEPTNVAVDMRRKGSPLKKTL
ncbi:hypothetical protein Hanom_Chr08g00697611 [Helianthus anomalus]